QPGTQPGAFPGTLAPFLAPARRSYPNDEPPLALGSPQLPVPAPPGPLPKESHMLRWLTTVFARFTKRHPSGPPLRMSWNGHPLVDAPEGMRRPAQPAPPTTYSTLTVAVPADGSKPARAPARPAE